MEKNWRAVLLGFDKTAHHIDNFKIEVSEDGLSAVSHSQVLAYHVIKGIESEDGESWVLRG